MQNILCDFQFAILDWDVEIVNWLIRLLIACVCGFAIGFERKSRSKEAGIRTHSIVCMAACLMMIVSKYGFSDSTTGDAGRIAAQVVSGIGFLGAGIIFYKRDFLHGLTTAAGVWATAGIGLAIGAGMIVIGVFSATILVLLQVLLHRPWFFNRGTATHVLKLTVTLEDEHTVDKITSLFYAKKFIKFKTSAQEDGVVKAEIELVTDKDFPAQALIAFTKENSFIRTIEKYEEM